MNKKTHCQKSIFWRWQYWGYFSLLLISVNCIAVETKVKQTQWVSIPLGVAGGIEENNLSAYLLAPAGSTDFICLDAGTLYQGLNVARQAGSFATITIPTDVNPAMYLLRQHVKAYLISHAHLDHLNGLILNATDDSAKPILGLPIVLTDIQNNLFNWRIFPNFADAGVQPYLKKYHYITLEPATTVDIPNTSLKVTAFPLSHGKNYDSTAFLIQANEHYALYLGDTGADSIENSDKLQQLWAYIAPLVKKQQLNGIFIESAYPNARPTNQLYGHLTPALILQSLQQLAQQVDSEHPEQALKDLTIIVTHIKPNTDTQIDNRALIQNELTEENHLNLTFILAEQGQRIEF
ncbi:low-affinity cAMP phosphodiesterase [Beggiatoa alba B18LD]|uniref:Low-affinity cAMP phosphodiesterase n=1 Tax=Beggiatoa alba B18LD TaxID=395493 RepID=I3CG61_9GAMM|nr:3',5'-cyclic-nucleotide phosphodiesterase [Beggiatoa alba]EIJ42604.1 low-affinity cAMP phosphodiesterase [Beggiatoa alba B18LD]